jgi:predicted nucleic acid-binding protein
MGVILLDSNTIIYLSKGLLSIDDILPDEETYAVSVVTYMEVMGYPFESKHEEQLITELFGHFNIIMIDTRIANQVIALRKNYKIKLPDAIICATALTHRAQLLTNDDRLKQIKELKLKIINPLTT